jgi:hypothetical protein
METDRCLVWRRSGRCGSNACVEVAYDDLFTYVRSSRDPRGPSLRFAHAAWEAFLGSSLIDVDRHMIR